MKEPYILTDHSIQGNVEVWVYNADKTRHASRFSRVTICKNSAGGVWGLGRIGGSSRHLTDRELTRFLSEVQPFNDSRKNQLAS